MKEWNEITRKLMSPAWEEAWTEPSTFLENEEGWAIYHRDTNEKLEERAKRYFSSLLIDEDTELLPYSAMSDLLKYLFVQRSIYTRRLESATDPDEQDALRKILNIYEGLILPGNRFEVLFRVYKYCERHANQLSGTDKGKRWELLANVIKERITQTDLCVN